MKSKTISMDICGKSIAWLVRCVKQAITSEGYKMISETDLQYELKSTINKEVGPCFHLCAWHPQRAYDALIHNSLAPRDHCIGFIVQELVPSQLRVIVEEPGEFEMTTIKRVFERLGASQKIG